MEIEKVIRSLPLEGEIFKGFNVGLDFIQETFNSGDLILVTSSFGSGKTTLATKMANNLYLGGCKILQLSSEDRIENVQLKHFAAMTGIPLGEIDDEIGEVNLKVAKIMSKNTGEIFLRKGNYDDIRDVESPIHETLGKSGSLDVLVIDALSSNLNISSLKKLAVEHNLLIIGTVQGNRESIGNPQALKTSMTNHLFASASFVIGVNSTQKQKAKTLATVNVFKNRYGVDGISGEVYFNYGTLEIRKVLPYWDVFLDNLKVSVIDIFKNIFDSFKGFFSVMFNR